MTVSVAIVSFCWTGCHLSNNGYLHFLSRRYLQWCHKLQKVQTDQGSGVRRGLCSLFKGTYCCSRANNWCTVYSRALSIQGCRRSRVQSRQGDLVFYPAACMHALLCSVSKSKHCTKQAHLVHIIALVYLPTASTRYALAPPTRTYSLCDSHLCKLIANKMSEQLTNLTARLLASSHTAQILRYNDQLIVHFMTEIERSVEHAYD